VKYHELAVPTTERENILGLFMCYVIFVFLRWFCTWFAVVTGWGKSRRGRARKSSSKNEKKSEDNKKKFNQNNKWKK
jgi:hypothetical protein